MNVVRERAQLLLAEQFLSSAKTRSQDAEFGEMAKTARKDTYLVDRYRSRAKATTREASVALDTSNMFTVGDAVTAMDRTCCWLDRGPRGRVRIQHRPRCQIHWVRGADTRVSVCFCLGSRYTPDTQPDTQIRDLP